MAAHLGQPVHAVVQYYQRHFPHDSFYVRFKLSSGETEDDFTWHFDCLKELQRKHQVGDSTVICSDFCRGFKKAAKKAYPSNCVFGTIVKNMHHHIAKKWVQSDDEGAVLAPTPTTLATSLDAPGPDPPTYTAMMQEMEDFDFMDPVEVDDDLAADPAVDPGPDADAGERRAGIMKIRMRAFLRPG